ncbi:MAG: acetyl ornithine aminotransferase family protein [Actinomycetota bacterium]
MTAASESPEELAEAQAPKLVTDIPGPEALALIERDRKVTSPSLPRAYPFVSKRGAGSVVEDVDGNRFLDLNAGIAVTSTGHCHPQLVEAIQEQAAKLIHYSASDFFLPIYTEVCEHLDRIAPMSKPVRSFLTNSGTEAVEAAIKLARYATGRQYIVGFFNSFHGRSYGSVSVTASKSLYRANFGPMLPGVVHAPYGDGRDFGDLSFGEDAGPFPTIDYFEKVLFKRLVEPTEVAAVIVEPVLGEGGYIVPPDGWLEALRELCTRHGILMVADEVQCGMGRTGKMWAVQHFDVEPDVLLSGKGIASGMPLGAMIAREDLMTWRFGAHGSTYGGNPVSCAAALATIRLIEEGLVDNARTVGDRMMNGLRDVQQRHDIVEEIRGLGLMIGIGLRDHETADQVEKAAFRRGALMLRCGDDAIRMSPPLVFREDQADTAVSIFEEACAEVAG